MEDNLITNDNESGTKKENNHRKKKTKSKKNADCKVRCEVCQVDFTDLFSLENHINQFSKSAKSSAENQDVKCNEMACSNCHFKFGGFDNPLCFALLRLF